MERFGKESTRGQALVMFVLVAAVLVMVLGLAIDASGAWWKSQRQNDAIEIAKESASRSNEIKFNATDSTRALDEIIYSSLTENLRDLGGSEVSVTSWEVPETKSGSMNRLIGVEVSVTGTYRCVFAQTFGFASVPVKNTITFTINRIHLPRSGGRTPLAMAASWSSLQTSRWVRKPIRRSAWPRISPMR